MRSSDSRENAQRLARQKVTQAPSSRNQYSSATGEAAKLQHYVQDGCYEKLRENNKTCYERSTNKGHVQCDC